MSTQPRKNNRLNKKLREKKRQSFNLVVFGIKTCGASEGTHASLNTQLNVRFEQYHCNYDPVFIQSK